VTEQAQSLKSPLGNGGGGDYSEKWPGICLNNRYIFKYIFEIGQFSDAVDKFETFSELRGDGGPADNIWRMNTKCFFHIFCTVPVRVRQQSVTAHNGVCLYMSIRKI